MFQLHLLIPFVTAFFYVANADKAKVEVLVVLDNTSWDAWTREADIAGNTVDDEINSVFKEVHRMYDALDMQVRFKNNSFLHVDEIILQSNASYGNNLLDYKQATEVFSQWLQNQDDVRPYDAALLIAGYNLAEGYEPGIAGYSYGSSACTDGAVGVVEATFDMHMIVEIARQIGHIVGASFDGDGNSCNPYDGYIMTSLTSYEEATNRPNFATWSSCSQQAIKDFVNSSQALCLWNTTASKIQSSRFGLIVGADEMCRRRGGNSMYATRLKEEIPRCVAVTCESHLTLSNVRPSRSFELYLAPAGMPCSNGKLCNLGQCIEDDNGLNDLDENCLYGDTPFFTSTSYVDCADILNKGACYGDNTKICCSSCSGNLG